jgi:Xaa-Pro aminopeptidase
MYGNYDSAVGRTFCIGKMPDEFKKLAKVGIDLQKVIKNTIKAGINISIVFKKYLKITYRHSACAGLHL